MRAALRRHIPLIVCIIGVIAAVLFSTTQTRGLVPVGETPTPVATETTASIGGVRAYYLTDVRQIVADRRTFTSPSYEFIAVTVPSGYGRVIADVDGYTYPIPAGERWTIVPVRSGACFAIRLDLGSAMPYVQGCTKDLAKTTTEDLQ